MKFNIFFVIALFSSSVCLASETVISDPLEIMQFLISNPEAQAIPLAATLASGVVSQVTSITTRDCQAYASGKSMYITIQMKSNGGFSGTQNFSVSCPK